MAFGLEDLVLLDLAELADRTIDRTNEIGIGQWACTGTQGTRKEFIKTGVAGDIRIRRFSHVHIVFADEPAYQRSRQASRFGARDQPGKGSQGLFWQ